MSVDPLCNKITVMKITGKGHYLSQREK